MRWLAVGMVLTIALVVAIALLIGLSNRGDEPKRAPRVRQAPPASVLSPVRS